MGNDESNEDEQFRFDYEVDPDWGDDDEAEGGGFPREAAEGVRILGAQEAQDADPGAPGEPSKRFGDRPDEAMLGLGRFVRQGNGELPSVANPAVNLGHINAGSFLTLSEATAGLSLTPQHGLEHGPR